MCQHAYIVSLTSSDTWDLSSGAATSLPPTSAWIKVVAPAMKADARMSQFMGLCERNSRAGDESRYWLCCLTFELSGRQRQDARPGLAKMYCVLPDRAWWLAVGAPLEQGVGSHFLLSLLLIAYDVVKKICCDEVVNSIFVAEKVA